MKVMKTIPECAVLAGVFLFLLFAPGTRAGCDASDSDVLRGIKSIGIEIDHIPRMAEKLGIKKESLQADVSSRLERAGITVASGDDGKLSPSTPFLKVSLIIGYSNPTYIYAVVVGLNEKVSFERDPGIISYAMPWWRIVKGEHIGEKDIVRDIEETLRYIMNEFIANYAAVNSGAISDEGTGSEQHSNHLEVGTNAGNVVP